MASKPNDHVQLLDGTVSIYIDSPKNGTHIVVVDAEDYEVVATRRWHLQREPHTLYAITHVRQGDGRKATMRMHQLLTASAHRPGFQVDHIDRDGLNNTRVNLRVVTPAENNRNRRLLPGNTSGYRGVSWHAGRRKWRVRIRVGSTYKSLGCFFDPVEAARRFDQAAIEAGFLPTQLNFPEEAVRG